MNASKILLLNLLVLALSSALLAAQQVPCLNRIVPVNAVADDGQIVKGLTALNFRASVQGRAVQIQSAFYDAQPRRVVILLDASGSMTGGDRWPPAITAIKNFLYELPPDTNVAFRAFAKKNIVSVDLGAGRKVVSDEVHRVEMTDWTKYEPAGGKKTALFDAVSGAIGLLHPVQAGDSIFLVTDGGENVSQATGRDVKSQLVPSNMRVFVFLPTDKKNRELPRPLSFEETNGAEVLAHWAHDSGGDMYIYPPKGSLIDGPEVELDNLEQEMRIRKNASYIPAVARVVANEISGFYALRISLSGRIEKPRGLRVEILDRKGKKDDRWRLNYPHRLPACD